MRAHARAGMKSGSTERVTAMEEFFKKNGCIQGYHVYKEVWQVVVGEALVCKREFENGSD